MKTAISPAFKLMGLLPKAPKMPAPTPAPKRDEVAATIEAEDELRRRRGGAADILTGKAGAEASSAGGKQSLGA